MTITKPRNVPLAIRRTDLAMLQHELTEHRGSCPECQPRQVQAQRKGKLVWRTIKPEPCDGQVKLAAELKAARDDVAHWFDPDPNDPTLW